MATRPTGLPPRPTALATPEGAPPIPPPGAPRERNQPLKPELLAEQLAKARENERTLEPLAYVGVVPQPPAPKVSLKPSAAVPAGAEDTAGDLDTASSLAKAFTESLASRGLDIPAPSAEVGGTAPATEPGPGEEANARSAEAEEGTALARNPFPAGSDTDSPSRGIPHPSHDPGKQVTGGFGVGAMEYFALDGSEVQVIVKRLLARLGKQLEADLRLTLAITYPQVRIRALVSIDGATEASSVNAQAFDLVEAEILHLEAVEVDDPETPPDALRDEAGLERPFKRVVQMGAGRTLADREVR
jgi:hypothetical protein